MPVPLAVDQPTEVVLCAVFGCRYGVIRWRVDGRWVQAPVSFASVRIVGDYAGEMGRAAAGWLLPGARVWVTACAVAEGPRQELAIVEVAAAAGRASLGVQAVAQGWAVPDARVSAHAFTAQPYREALTQARTLRRGIWGEAPDQGEAWGLSRELLQQTAPALAPPPAHAAGTWGVLALVALALVGGAARRGGRSDATAAPMTTTAQQAGRRPQRLWWRMLRWYGGGLPGVAPSWPAGGAPARRPGGVTTTRAPVAAAGATAPAAGPAAMSQD